MRRAEKRLGRESSKMTVGDCARMSTRSSSGGRSESIAIDYLRGAAALIAITLLAGCATQGDLLKLKERVMDEERRKESRPDPFERIAALSLEVEALREEQRRIEGQLEVAQKTADDALNEAMKARETLAAQGLVAGGGVAAAVDRIEQPGEVDEQGADDATTSTEVVAYQEALAAWRGGDHAACIDRFRKFLQTYPASPYADDAAYWMADCHFKQGDYRVAVLRFNDVVRVYPNGNKAPDALYRQGESLLKLGPGFYDAAKTVFKQVLEEYPDSDRAREARQQLEAIGDG
jgi:tol-pal system protein YbgF